MEKTQSNEEEMTPIPKKKQEQRCRESDLRWLSPLKYWMSCCPSCCMLGGQRPSFNGWPPSHALW